MEEKTNMSEMVAEIEGASDEELRGVIERWFERTRTSGMKIGAFYISAAVADAIKKNVKTGSLRDYQRATKAVMDIVSVQLKQHETQQNDLEEAMEEIDDDGTAE